MDPALIAFGVLVILFDAYAYKKYVDGMQRLEKVSSTSGDRAFKVREQFYADQEPQRGESAKSNHSPRVAPIQVTIPLRTARASALDEARPASGELLHLKSELDLLGERLSSIEKTVISKPRALTETDLDSKESELHKLFLKRRIDGKTYETVKADITRLRLGL